MTERIFCETCLKPVTKDEALMSESRDFVAYFCSEACYAKWRSEREPEPAPEIQEGSGGRSKARDDRLKHMVKQHPQRDEPRADSVEGDELPPP
jgi:hypothetical protein